MAQHLQHDFGVFGVEVSSRLVCKHDRGPIDQRPCQSNSLLLAAGEFRWPMRQSLTQAKKTNNLVKVRGVAGAVLSRYVNCDLDIRARIEGWQQIEFLKYEPNLGFAKVLKSARIRVADRMLSGCSPVGRWRCLRDGASNGAFRPTLAY